MLNFFKVTFVNLFWELGGILCVATPFFAFMTYVLMRDTLKLGLFIPYQLCWLAAGLFGTGLLGKLLLTWLHGMARLA